MVSLQAIVEENQNNSTYGRPIGDLETFFQRATVDNGPNDVCVFGGWESNGELDKKKKSSLVIKNLLRVWSSHSLPKSLSISRLLAKSDNQRGVE